MSKNDSIDRVALYKRLEDAANSRIAEEAERYTTVIQVLGTPEDAKLTGLVGRIDSQGARLLLADKLKQFSPSYKDSNLSTIPDPAAINMVCDAIYNDAERAARAYRGPLKKVTTRDEYGRNVTKFFGDSAAAWGPFMGGGVQFGRINHGMADAARAAMDRHDRA